jgi:hypothetical protein
MSTITFLNHTCEHGRLPEDCQCEAVPASGSVSDFPELHPVPVEIAVCPECRGQLHWQRDGVDDGDLMIDCAEEDWEDDDGIHRGWQSEWQPVLDRVKAWLSKLNVKDEGRRTLGLSNTKDQQ